MQAGHAVCDRMLCILQVKGAEKVLYGLDDVEGQDTIIVVEGRHVGTGLV